MKSVPEQRYSYKYFKMLHHVDYNCPVWEDGAWSVMIECLCHQEQTMLLMVQIDNYFISAKWKGVFCYFILKMFAKYDNRAI